MFCTYRTVKSQGFLPLLRMKLADARGFLSLLYTYLHKKRGCRGSPNIYGNKYSQPEYLWNRWPDVFGIRTSVKFVCA